MKVNRTWGIACCTVTLLLTGACRRDRTLADYKSVAGFVVAAENCTGDKQKDYWLIDLSYRDNEPAIGDTITIDGETYNNVVKIKGLRPDLQFLGKAVGLDYKKLSTTKVQTTGCTAATPVTYTLTELFPILQTEIRN